MAKAARLPKLKWKRNAGGAWVTDDGYEAFVGAITVGSIRKLYVVFKDNGYRLGYATTLVAAKAIAQAFADSETLRGEGG